MEDNSAFCNECGAKAGTVLEEKTKNNQENYYSNNELIFKYNGMLINLQDIIDRNGKNKINSIKELRELAGIDLATAKKVIDEAYLGRVYTSNQISGTVTNSSDLEKKKNGCLTVTLWVLFFPIMIIIAVAKSEKISKGTKAILIPILVVIFLIAGIIGQGSEQTQSDTNIAGQTTTNDTQSANSETSKDAAASSKTNSFDLKYGELGTYGETISDNKDYEYIVYNVPAGTYKVNSSTFGILFVVKKASYKNSSGYIEHETVSINRFNDSVKDLNITVNDDERITISANSEFTLSK